MIVWMAMTLLLGVQISPIMRTVGKGALPTINVEATLCTWAYAT